MEKSIPKKIHYFWFGNKPLPALAKKCIKSWERFLPDYELVFWNESNFDVNEIEYVREAYENEAYAFVSDYARFKILAEQGGLYFDTDVEIIKPIDDIIKSGPFMACQDSPSKEHNRTIKVNPGLCLGAFPNMKIYDEILASYKNSHFVKKDGSLDHTTVVDRATDILNKHGLKNINEIQSVANLKIYPQEYFNPKSFIDGSMNITKNTYAIHHFASSWLPKKWKKIMNKLHKWNKIDKKIKNINFLSKSKLYKNIKDKSIYGWKNTEEYKKIIENFVNN